jgi:hypothetical protein
MNSNKLPKNIVVFLGFVTIIGLTVFLIPSSKNEPQNKK